MLSGTAATEVHACDEDTHTWRSVGIQYELWVRIAIFKVTPVVKEKFTETGSLNAFEELFGIIWSVSTLIRSSGTTRPTCSLNASIFFS